MDPDPPDLLESLPAAQDLGPEGLSEAALTGIDLSGHQAAASEVDGCRLERVDLSGARLSGGRVRGISMPWEDAVANAGLFATACGIEVEID